MTDSDGGRALAGHIRCTARATRRCLRVRSPASHPRTSPAPAIAPRRLLARPRALLGSPIPSAATLCLWQMVGSPSRSTRRRRSTYLFTAATPAFDSGGARAEHPHPARHSAGALMVTPSPSPPARAGTAPTPSSTSRASATRTSRSRSRRGRRRCTPRPRGGAAAAWMAARARRLAMGCFDRDVWVVQYITCDRVRSGSRGGKDNTRV